jgi:hypothetical protein
MLGLFEDAFLYAPPPPIRPFHWASRLEDGGGEDPGEGRQPGTAPVDAMRPAALLPGDVQGLRRAISAGEGLPTLLAQSNSFQNLALAQARPAPAADPASASTSASASASAASSSSSSASEFEHGLRVVMHEIVKAATNAISCYRNVSPNCAKVAATGLIGAAQTNVLLVLRTIGLASAARAPSTEAHLGLAFSMLDELARTRAQSTRQALLRKPSDTASRLDDPRPRFYRPPLPPSPPSPPP